MACSSPSGMYLFLLYLSIYLMESGRLLYSAKSMEFVRDDLHINALWVATEQYACPH